MKTQTDKAASKKSKAVATTSADNRRNQKESEVQFEDNRAEAVAQRQLGGMSDNSTHASKVAQLQAIANDTSPEPVQKQGLEEELLQGKFDTVQKQEEEEELQMKSETIQRQGAEEEEEPLQGKFETIQKQGLEEEEPLQGKFETIQKQGLEEEEIQAKSAIVQKKEQKPANNTGLPDTLKSGIENLSGLSLDDVKVHYNSPEPAQLQAHAFAQGTDIHMAPGQEKHLPHEAWHVVQQKQGRVKPIRQLKGALNVNDDAGLDKEADVMGSKPSSIEKKEKIQLKNKNHNGNSTIQRKLLDNGDELFAKSVNRWWPRYKSSNLKTLVTEVNKTQAILDGSEDANEKLSSLLRLQLALEKWRHKEPKEYEARKARWAELNREIRTNIEEITNERIQAEGEGLTGAALAEQRGAELISLAMRITVLNAPKYFETGFAEKHAAERSEIQSNNPDRPNETKPVPANKKGMTQKGLEMREKGVEHNGEGICSAFAAAAASKLSGQGTVRVEIMGSARQHHNFVVIGRAAGSELNNIESWGQNCRVIDCWWGAIKWRGYGEYPRVVYTPGEHINKLGNKPNAVYFDSQGGEADVDNDAIDKLSSKDRIAMLMGKLKL